MENKSTVMLSAIFSIIVLILSLNLVYASPICSGTLCGSVTSSPSNVKHGTVITINFDVTFEGTASSTTLDFSGSTTNIGSWSTLPPSTTTIATGTTGSMTAKLTIPTGSTGIINPVIKVKSGTNANADVVVPAITIDEDKSLLISPDTQRIMQSVEGSITVKNTGNFPLNDVTLSQSGPFTVSFDNSNFALNAGATKTIKVTANDLSNLGFGDNIVTITAEDLGNNVRDTATLTSPATFCKSGSVGGNLSITKIDINSDGDDDEEWKLLDTIEIEVDIDNDGDIDIDDVEVHLGLFDSRGKNQASDLDFENTDEEKIELGDINDGDDDTVTFRFRVPADFDSGKYKLAIKAFGDKLGESVECTDFSDDLSDNFFQDIDVNQEDDEGKFIAFEDIEIRPTEEVTCGDTVTINMDVFNIGDNDQDQVRVNLLNSEMGINLDREIRQDLDEGDKEGISFTFVVPPGLADKLYTMELTADYDYRRGSYRESSDDSTKFGLRVIGCGLAPGPGPGTSARIAFITATLDSNAMAGEELVVKSTITGLLPRQADYVVSASGYESWSTLNSISERVLPLGEGQSRDIVLSFSVKEGISGEQTFTLETRSGDLVERREVAVSIEGSGSSGGTGIDFGDNSLIWVIGIINVILIILIIIVAARISRR
jgi:hypothetical protein